LRKRETWFSILRLRVSETEKWEEYMKASHFVGCSHVTVMMTSSRPSNHLRDKHEDTRLILKRTLERGGVKMWTELNWTDSRLGAMEGFHNHVRATNWTADVLLTLPPNLPNILPTSASKTYLFFSCGRIYLWLFTERTVLSLFDNSFRCNVVAEARRAQYENSRIRRFIFKKNSREVEQEVLGKATFPL
jgi:hypothetical protein